MSSFHAAWSGGGLVGAAFGGLLISRGASVSEQLGIEALATLAIALAASFQIGAGDARPAERLSRSPTKACRAGGDRLSVGVRRGGGQRLERALSQHRRRHDARGRGERIWGYALTMFFGRAFGDGVVHRLGRTRVVAIGALAVFAGVALAVGTASPPAVVAGFCVVGLGLANMAPAVFSASAAAATTPSLEIATAATLAYASNRIGPPIIGASRPFRACARPSRCSCRRRLRSSLCVRPAAARRVPPRSLSGSRLSDCFAQSLKHARASGTPLLRFFPRDPLEEIAGMADLVVCAFLCRSGRLLQ